MHLFSTLLVAILGSTVIAAPITEPALDISAAATQWTLQAFTRTCNAADTSCKYSFTINPRDSTLTICSYLIHASKQASHASYSNIKCGKFVISSSWSGQFGPGNGFQTLGVVRNRYAFPLTLCYLEKLNDWQEIQPNNLPWLHR